jgi:hypothetical protein
MKKLLVAARLLAVIGLTAPQPTKGTEAAHFAVVITSTHHDLDGARAESRGGTAWKDLGWHCGESPCRARVDGFGVVVPAPRR